MFDINQFWYIIKQRYWILIASVMTIVITVAVHTLYQVPVYKATTTLIIESDIPSAIDFGGTFEIGPHKKYYNTQYKIIKSSAVVKKALDIIDSQYKAEYISRKNPVKAFSNSIVVEPFGNSQLVNISVKNLDPRSAAEQANAVAAAYIIYNLEDRKSASRDVFTWLSEQIAIIKDKVEKSELALLLFKEKSRIVKLEERQVLYEENMSILQKRYSAALAEHTELETTLNEIKRLRSSSEIRLSLPRKLETNLFLGLKGQRNELITKLSLESQKFKDKHPAIINLRSQISAVESLMINELDNIINGLEIEYKISTDHLTTVKNSLDILKEESILMAKQAIKYGVLEREAISNKEMYGILLQRLKETDIGENITANNIRVVDKANVPGRVRSQMSQNVTRAALIGLILGVLLSLVFDYFDNTLKVGEDIAQHLKVPLIGLVPKEKIDDFTSPEAEKLLGRYYRDIKTTIGFYKKEHVLKTMLITSSIRNEGKTTSVLFLSKAFAQSGSKVLLIDADVFKPRIAKLLNLTHEKGLVDFVNNGIDAKEIIYNSDTPNLSVIPGGLIPPNPVEVVGSEKIPELIDKVKNDYDFVIIDAPPLSAALEVSVLGSTVDGIAVIVKAEHTSRALVKKLFEGMDNAKGNVLGVILNYVTRISGEMSAYYYYKYYGKYYGKDN